MGDVNGNIISIKYINGFILDSSLREVQTCGYYQRVIVFDGIGILLVTVNKPAAIKLFGGILSSLLLNAPFTSHPLYPIFHLFLSSLYSKKILLLLLRN